MATVTARGALPYPDPGGPTNIPQDIQNLAAALAVVGVFFSMGKLSARPAAHATSGTAGTSSYVPSTAGRFYIATDQSPIAVYLDYGADWLRVNVNPLTGVITAPGDLVVGGPNGVPTRLAVGDDGQALIARASASGGVHLDWENLPASGRGLPLAATGATTATRYVGGTVSGPPTSGTFQAGDFVVTAAQGVWVCTVGGSPGTWVSAAGVPTFHMVFDTQDITSGPYQTLTKGLSGFIDTHGGVTTSGYVITRPGAWHFDFHAAYHPYGYGQRYARLARNGDPAGASGSKGYAWTGVSAWSNGAPGAGGYQGPAGSLVYPYRLAVGDVITLQVAQDSGATVSIYGGGLSDVGTVLSGHWLHD